MRITITALFLSVFLISAVAQEEIDPRLHAVYEADYLENIKEHNPSLLLRLNYYLDHSYYLMEYAEEKGPADFPEITVEDLDNVNILLLEKELDLVRDFEKQSVYKVAGTDQVLVFHSGKRFNEMLNEHLAEQRSKN